MVLKGKISITALYTHSIAVECLVMWTISKDGVPKIVHDTFLLGQPLAFVGSGKITNRVPQIVCLIF